MDGRDRAGPALHGRRLPPAGRPDAAPRLDPLRGSGGRGLHRQGQGGAAHLPGVHGAGHPARHRRLRPAPPRLKRRAAAP
ncbi:MAG: hypothetical protein MZV70_06705 [Desulfobacterales bacterium]|nr:hypothetical protein [Desulfobacterales bacterium]